MFINIISENRGETKKIRQINKRQKKPGNKKSISKKKYNNIFDPRDYYTIYREEILDYDIDIDIDDDNDNDI